MAAAGILHSPVPQLIGRWRVLKLSKRIGDKRIIKGVEDTIQWMGTKNGLFYVKTMY